eukprot:TRINITY_DN34508_c0_g1_i1.p1 TRINITY_DN34508_c0_g1~~TRINITY_DN34508_c0_g1_i1.p1  ORF type:complete len:196 (-),score=53.27 TRINITY_DN34508_c0_g1_i1:63-596(-)
MGDWAIPSLRSEADKKWMRNREMEFNNPSKVAALPEYNPLFDVNLKHLWLNPRMKQTMQQRGFMDEHGGIIDVDAHRRKLYVIEQELAQASAVERNRAQEKERRVKDCQTLARRQEVFEKHLRNVAQVREERRRRKEALQRAATLSSLTAPSGPMSSHTAGSLPALKGASGSASVSP